MLLQINKDQAEKFFGGVKFSISFRALLTNDERSLIDKYKIADTILMQAKKKLIVEYEIKITIDNLIRGHKFVADSIDILHDYESEIIVACRRLISLIDELRKFGGDIYLEITPNDIEEISTQDVQALLSKQKNSSNVMGKIEYKK